MIRDPVVIVTCDKCGYEEQHDMTALARNSWDMRGIVAELRRAGWLVEGDGDRTICPECAETKGETDAESEVR